jgi:uncharacterized protein with HEPN domain
MNDRPVLAWLNEARQFALEARRIVQDLDEGAFALNTRDQYAVRYCLAVVGEALNQVAKDVQALAPEIQWHAIYNLRNRLIHSYWLVNPHILLRIAKHDIAPLVASIDGLSEKIK